MHESQIFGIKCSHRELGSHGAGKLCFENSYLGNLKISVVHHIVRSGGGVDRPCNSPTRGDDHEQENFADIPFLAAIEARLYRLAGSRNPPDGNAEPQREDPA